MSSHPDRPSKEAIEGVESPQSSWKFWPSIQGWARGAFVDNLGIKGTALALSLVAFWLVNEGKDDTGRTAVMGVEVNIGYDVLKDRTLISGKVDQVRIEIRGTVQAIREFNKRELNPPLINLNALQSGVYVFQKDLFTLPSDIELVSVNPASMNLLFEDNTTKEVPIRVVIKGTPKEGYILSSPVALPDSVKVKGGKSVVAALSELQTEEVNIQGLSPGFTREVELKKIGVGLELVDAKKIAITIAFEEERIQESLEQVKVVLKAKGQGALISGIMIQSLFRLDPPTVSVTLHGPKMLVEEALQKGISPVVRISPDVVTMSQETEVILDIPGVAREIIPSRIKVIPIVK